MNRYWMYTAMVLFLAPFTLGFDLTPSTIPPSEILSGGPPKDGIPALDHPKSMAAADAAYLNRKSEIIGVVINGETRAYPIAILNWHEVVNDTVGGLPIVITY